ncbi:MAG: hypothetical protein PT954_01020, partial [Eubacteriales bacterium]|nr:hypothetical protein [Eubacteriales bacterium]
MGNILFSVGGLVLFHKTSINPCTLSVEDVFPLHVYPFSPFFSRTDTESLPFWYDFGCPSFFQDFLPNLLQFRGKSGILSVAFEESYRLRAGCREMSVGARHSCGFFRRAFVSTFQAAGEE